MVHQGLTSQQWARRARALSRATLADDEIGRRLAELADAWRAAEAASFAECSAFMTFYNALMPPSRDEIARDAARERWDAAQQQADATFACATRLESALGSELRCELQATADVVYGRPATSRAKTPGERRRAMVVLWRRPDPEA